MFPNIAKKKKNLKYIVARSKREFICHRQSFPFRKLVQQSDEFFTFSLQLLHNPSVLRHLLAAGRIRRKLLFII